MTTILTEFRCPHAESSGTAGPGGIDEAWPTLGEGRIRVVLCPACRRITSHYEGSALCDGRCGGHCDSIFATRADCTDCSELEVGGSALQTTWSCLDPGCVHAWADTHPHCLVEITPGRAA